MLVKTTVYFRPKSPKTFHEILYSRTFPYLILSQKVQDQPKVMMVVVQYPMLYTKIQGHQSIGSGQEAFLRFLPFMVMSLMQVA